ncbi:MAG: hypothetical protein J2P17_09710, partial [Mycobacterium sp.]|nr:hypothetical protein [Mycobacterium sp.]
MTRGEDPRVGLLDYNNTDKLLLKREEGVGTVQETRLQGEIHQMLEIIEGRVKVRANLPRTALHFGFHQIFGGDFMRSASGVSGTLTQVAHALYDQHGIGPVPKIPNSFPDRIDDHPDEWFNTREQKLEATARMMVEGTIAHDGRIELITDDNGMVVGVKQRGRPYWVVATNNRDIAGDHERIERGDDGRITDRINLDSWRVKTAQERGIIDWMNKITDERVRSYVNEINARKAADEPRLQITDTEITLKYTARDADWYFDHGNGSFAETLANKQTSEWGPPGSISLGHKADGRGASPKPTEESIKLGGPQVISVGGPKHGERPEVQIRGRTQRGDYKGDYRRLLSLDDLYTENTPRDVVQQIIRYVDASEAHQAAVARDEVESTEETRTERAAAEEDLHKAQQTLQEEAIPAVQKAVEQRLLADKRARFHHPPTMPLTPPATPPSVALTAPESPEDNDSGYDSPNDSGHETDDSGYDSPGDSGYESPSDRGDSGDPKPGNSQLADQVPYTLTPDGKGREYSSVEALGDWLQGAKDYNFTGTQLSFTTSNGEHLFSATYTDNGMIQIHGAVPLHGSEAVTNPLLTSFDDIKEVIADTKNTRATITPPDSREFTASDDLQQPQRADPPATTVHKTRPGVTVSATDDRIPGPTTTTDGSAPDTRATPGPPDESATDAEHAAAQLDSTSPENTAGDSQHPEQREQQPTGHTLTPAGLPTRTGYVFGEVQPVTDKPAPIDDPELLRDYGPPRDTAPRSTPAPRRPTLAKLLKLGRYAKLVEATSPAFGPTGRPQPEDVTQGQLGTCHLHSVLIDMARKHPDWLASLFTLDDEERITGMWWRIGKTDTWEWFATDLHFPVDRDGRPLGVKFDKVSWPAVAEQTCKAALGNNYGGGAEGVVASHLLPLSIAGDHGRQMTLRGTDNTLDFHPLLLPTDDFLDRYGYTDAAHTVLKQAEHWQQDVIAWRDTSRPIRTVLDGSAKSLGAAVTRLTFKNPAKPRNLARALKPYLDQALDRDLSTLDTEAATNLKNEIDAVIEQITADVLAIESGRALNENQQKIALHWVQRAKWLAKKGAVVSFGGRKTSLLREDGRHTRTGVIAGHAHTFGGPLLENGKIVGAWFINPNKPHNHPQRFIEVPLKHMNQFATISSAGVASSTLHGNTRLIDGQPRQTGGIPDDFDVDDMEVNNSPVGHDTNVVPAELGDLTVRDTPPTNYYADIDVDYYDGINVNDEILRTGWHPRMFTAEDTPTGEPANPHDTTPAPHDTAPEDEPADPMHLDEQDTDTDMGATADSPNPDLDPNHEDWRVKQPALTRTDPTTHQQPPNTPNNPTQT